MATASLALRTTNVTIANASVELRTTAAVICTILEIGVFQGAATASSYGFGRPAAQGVTPGTQSLFQRDTSGLPACVTVAGLTWGTSPTAPTIYHRRWNSAATIGVGVIFTAPRGFTVPVSASWVVFNITASSVLDFNMSIDE